MDEEVETCHFDFKEPCFNLLVHKIDLDASVTVNKTGSNWPRAVDAGVVPRANSTESVQYFWGHLCRCVRTMCWETDVKCLSLLLLKAVLSFELLRPSQPRQSAGLEFSRQNTWPSLFLQGNVITQSPLVSHFLWITVCLRSCTCISRRLKPAALRGDLILPSQILYYWVIYFMFWVFNVSYCIVDLT